MTPLSPLCGVGFRAKVKYFFYLIEGENFLEGGGGGVAGSVFFGRRRGEFFVTKINHEE